MTVAVHFKTLYGADSGQAICCLLRFGGAQILLDCGWDEQFSTHLLEPLLRVVPQLDLVLLSQPDLQHLGALPYLVGKKAGLKAPVYAATPIARLGPILYHDYYASLQAGSDFTLFEAEDIDAAFDRVKPVKHHQLLELEIQGLRFRLAGYPAGHMAGGTVWVIETGGEVIVYGPCTNHMKERHLRGGQLSDVPVRPALLVAGPGYQGRSAAAGKGPGPIITRSSRDASLMSCLRDVVSRGGNVMLPVDASGRLLELLLVLEKLMQDNKGFVYDVVLLSCVADSVVRATAGLVEWMSDELQREFNSSTNNPLLCKRVTRCHNLADVARLSEQPKVVLVTGLSLEHGLSRQLLVKWAGDSRNAVIFTQPPPPGSLGDQLLSAGQSGPRPLSLVMGRRVPLTGLELQEYETKRAEAAAAAAEEEAAAAAAAGAAADSGELLPLRESSGAIRQLKRNATGALEQVLGDNPFDAYEDVGVVDDGVLMDGFAPPPGATYCMFPDEQDLLVQDWDPYGAKVDTADLRQDEAEMEMAAVLPDEEELDLEDGPTKVVQETIQLTFAASVMMLEGYLGLSDVPSLAKILGRIAPRSLLLVGGGTAQLSQLAAACSSQLSKQQTKIVTPASGQDVSVRLVSSYRVCISQELLASLSRHQLGDYEVAWLDGMLAAASVDDPNADAAAAAASAEEEGQDAAAAGAAADGTGGAGGSSEEQQQQEPKPRVHWMDEEKLLMLMPPAAGPAAAGDGAAEPGPGMSSSMDLDAAGSVVTELAALPPSAAAAAAAAAYGGIEGLGPSGSSAASTAVEAERAVGDHGGIFIGDVKLSNLNQALAKAGLPSQFVAGRLLVKGSLLVSRQGDDGQLMVEGPLCDDYFKVRDVVYSLYNIC